MHCSFARVEVSISIILMLLILDVILNRGLTNNYISLIRPSSETQAGRLR